VFRKSWGLNAIKIVSADVRFRSKKDKRTEKINTHKDKGEGNVLPLLSQASRHEYVSCAQLSIRLEDKVGVEV
jgi:hypothetical protein